MSPLASKSLIAAAFSIGIGIGIGVLVLIRQRQRTLDLRKKRKKVLLFKKSDEDNDVVYDVIIVGGGPTGSTTSYYLQKHGNLKVAVLDKASFPRDKYCGDAIMGCAIDILEEMGVLQELIKEGKVVECLHGGFVSPSGHSFIANDIGIDPSKKNMSTRTFAIKRMILDDRMIKTCVKSGVTLFENAQVEETILSSSSSQDEEEVWTIDCADGRRFKARFLVAADGAASTLARKLGIVKDAPNCVAARQYIKAGTHNFKAQGCLLYPTYTVPGYVALFQHYDGSIDLGAYLLPGGPAGNEDIAKLYQDKIQNDPFVSRALGPNWEPEERVKVASLRVGGVPKSYGNRVLLVGDAAGQTDSLTGEGIHTGMLGGKIAAETIVELFREQDFSDEACSIYHKRWWKAFGYDFPISSLFGKIVSKFPLLMDAVPVASASKGGKLGSQFFADFGAVMTGAKPKTLLFRPSVAFPLFTATVSQIIKQFILRNERNYYTDPLSIQVNELARETSWDSQCLVDRTVPPGKVKMNKKSRMETFVQETFPMIISNPKKRVLILFGSEYGFAKSLANRAAQVIHEKSNNDIQARICDLKFAEKLVDFSKESFVLLIISTAGDGDPPVDAQQFFSNAKAKKLNLKESKLATLALGDSAYPKFCAAGKHLHKYLLDCGAQEIISLLSDETLPLYFEVDGDNSQKAEMFINLFAKSIICSTKELFNKQKSEEGDYLYSKVIQEGESLLGDRATKSEPYESKLLKRERLDTIMDKQEDKWHIVLKIPKSCDTDYPLMEYLPGDALGILPLNDPNEVMKLIKILPELGSFENELLGSKNLKHVPSFLLTNYSESSDDFWLSDALEAFMLKDTAETKKYDRKSLAKMIMNELSPLLPRFYSIASSPKADDGEIHLCVAAVRYEIQKRKPRIGICSTYIIDRVSIGDPVKVFIQRNPSFRIPENLNTPMVMIGPGTGIAPFRSFLRHEVNRTNRVLFFGCKHEDQDFLYKDELQGYPNLRLITAFSRDQPRKVYVQDKILENKEYLETLLKTKPDTEIYICGDGAFMAPAVRQVLDEHFSNLFDENRVHLDVWIV